MGLFKRSFSCGLAIVLIIELGTKPVFDLPADLNLMKIDARTIVWQKSNRFHNKGWLASARRQLGIGVNLREKGFDVHVPYGPIDHLNPDRLSMLASFNLA
jgi:hypothetical protein